MNPKPSPTMRPFILSILLSITHSRTPRPPHGELSPNPIIAEGDCEPSHSQWNEEMTVAEFLGWDDKTGGQYVEIGALDGALC